ncbi:MAG TPA: dephospho-CoA kinase [Gammaproteobacteria bacterium]
MGLTGGVASGKSAVTGMFAKRGVPVVDTDLIAREVVAPGEPGLTAVREAFGAEVLTATGELDRRKLRDIVFADEAQRRRLERILHPLIRARTLERLRALEAPYAIVAVPLLVETGFGKLVDRVLVVDCPEEVQLARLMARDALSREQATAMVRAQTDRATRLAAADDVIDNGGDLVATERQVEQLHRKYLELARS